MIRRMTSAFGVTVAFVSLAGASMLPTASAAPVVTEVAVGCSIRVRPNVWVDRPVTSIPASLGADCAATGAAYASWDVRHTKYGLSDLFIFDNKRSAVNSFYDWEHYGTYNVEPRNSWNSHWDLTQNARSYVVKSGSGITIKPARAGKFVTLSVATIYYSPALRRYRMWPKARVSLQYRACPTCAWKYLRAVRTAANGRATFGTYSPRTRYYRGVTGSSATVWGRTSAVTRR